MSRVLNLSHNVLGDLGNVWGVQNCSCGTVSLDVSSNNLTYASVLKLMGVPLCNGTICTPPTTAINSLLNLYAGGNQVSALGSDVLPATGILSLLDLSNNGITSVRGNTFSLLTRLWWLDLSDNIVTEVPSNFIPYSAVLESVDLSRNLLTALSQGFCDNGPALRSLNVANNRIAALPIYNNHLGVASNAQNNPLSCQVFVPKLQNCQCSNGLHLSNHCGYVRCTEQPTGCPSTVYFNKTNCSLAPWSSCVATTQFLGRQFYHAETSTFLVVTECATAFQTSNGTGHLEAYQLQNFTTSTNRLCSICSTSCPQGYTRVACTATSDAQCAKIDKLTTASIVAIALGISLVLFLGVVVTTLLYWRKEQQRQILIQTQNVLEMTQLRIQTERAELGRMERAWVIAESDLTFGRLLGIGGSARVIEGTWG